MRASLQVAKKLLKWRTRGELTNVADGDSKASRSISKRLFESLGVTASGSADPDGGEAGAKFEDAVRRFLASALGSDFDVGRGRDISEFEQYAHLRRVEAMVRDDTSGLLLDALGGDYRIKPDVVVSRSGDTDTPFLHASVSCKWTIRSDRVQNIRHEANMMIRHRRGRVPHIVAVTAEPLPSRLKSIALGTGELDCVYHVALPELANALDGLELKDQREELSRLIAQRRLADLGDLPSTLAR